MKKEEQLDYVRKLILSLLISSQQGLPLAVLEQEYYQEEKERIPWRKFGYENLVAFFNSAPQQFQVYDINNITYVRGIASEKSMHIQSLVSRQKNNSRPRYSTHTRYRTYNSTHNMQPLMRPIRISASMLIALLQHIEKYPSGISVRNAMRFIETQCPNIKLTVYDLRAQLREVSHRVYMDNNMIYPKLNDVSQKNTEHSRPRSQANSRNSNESHETEYVAAGISDEEDFVDNDALDDYVNDNRPRRPSEEFATDLPQNTSRTQYETMNDYDNADTNELGATHNGRTRDIPYSSRVSELISDKIKSRLRELVQKNPSGILCAELPEKYLNEFNVHLNYTELGFSSVREFVLYLPQIFYLKQQDGDGDYLLLSADKRPTVPDLEPPSNEHVEKRRNSRRRSEEDYNKTEDPPVPTDIPTNIANRAFVPDNAMNYYETVKLIPVTELKKETFLEVYVSEVFNPSFFWIHLRKYKEQLLQLMDDINEFYNKNYMNYIVPNVGLIKGLHCACIYDDKWHRAVIKSVKPDFQVTILFIDYGTVKTYPSDNICYLDKKFAHPPAQAIPCGLSNIRPHTGDRWTSTVNRYFCDKVLEALLAATICSIDAAHNSMMIILTDTSEEEQVHINDWLVNEKLARRAKTVRMCYFLYFYKECNVCDKSATRSPKLAGRPSAINTVTTHTTRDRYNKYNKADEVSDTEDKDIKKKDVEALRNVPFREDKVQSIERYKAQIARSSQESQSKPRLQVKSKLLEKMAALSAASSTNSSACTSRTSESFTRETAERDAKTEASPNSISERKPRDLDDEAVDEEEVFGKLSSMYGGRGHRTPCDWPTDNSPRPIAAARNSSLVTKLKLLKPRRSAIESESELQKSVKPARSHSKYYEQLIRREVEEKNIWSPEMSVKRVAKDTSQTVASLKRRMEIHADENITVTVPKNALEMVYGSDQSQDTSNITASSVENNSASSCDMLDWRWSAEDSADGDSASSCEKLADQEAVNGNGEICETKSNEKVGEDGDSSTGVTLVPSKCDAHSRSKSDTANTVVNNKYKELLDDLMESMQKNSADSSLVEKAKSPGSEPSQTPSRNCSSNSSSSNNSHHYGIIPPCNEECETLEQKSRKKIFNDLNTSSSGSNLDNESEMIMLLSSDSFTSTIDNSDQDQPNEIYESGSTSSSNNDSKRHQTNYKILESDTTGSPLVDDTEQQQSNQSSDDDSVACSTAIDAKLRRTNGTFENNSVVFSAVCDLKQPRPNVTAKTSPVSQFQQILKVTQSLAMESNSNLDSDDLSDSENDDSNEINDNDSNEINGRSAKSDESRDESIKDIRNDNGYDNKNDNKNEPETESECTSIECAQLSDDDMFDENKWDVGVDQDFLSFFSHIRNQIQT